MCVRSTAKAIILKDGRVLLNRCRDRYNGDYYSLPGGGQDKYETLAETLVRECAEETGYTVEPVRFAALCEEICDGEVFRQKYPQYAHKMLHIFICRVVSGAVSAPTGRDDLQTGVEWVDTDKLDGIRLLPEPLGKSIKRIISGGGPEFIGSFHIQYNHG